MKIYLKIISVALLGLPFFTHNVIACVPLDEETQQAYASNFQGFQSNFDLIDTLTQPQKGRLTTELHFFWTTGITLSDNPAYEPRRRVDVGGSAYKDKFFPCMQELLKGTQHVNIKFVCDDLTCNSNDIWINHLHTVYGNRFEMLSIGSVHENIRNAYADQTIKIDAIFSNAVAGNPAIASDFYRIIGMVHGRQLDEDYMKSTAFTYCDVDTFIYNVEKSVNNPNPEKSLTSLVTSIFEDYIKPNSLYFFGRKRNSNDVIHIKMNDVQAFKKFSDHILSQFDESHLLKLGSASFNSHIHDIIKLCETDENAFNHFFEKINIYIKIGNLFLITGPGLLDKCANIDFVQWYSNTCAGAWRVCGDLENISFERFFDKTSEGTRIDYRHIDKCMENYENMLKAFSYAQRFGAHHPFNISAKKYLEENFHYQSSEYLHILKDSVKTDPYCGDAERLIRSFTKSLNELPSTEHYPLAGEAEYYRALIKNLTKYGIAFKPLTVEDLL